jgi:hypothetical protein
MKNKITWGCEVFDKPLSRPRHMPAPSTHPQKQQETYARY